MKTVRNFTRPFLAALLGCAALGVYASSSPSSKLVSGGTSQTAPAPKARLTFSKDIAPLMFQHCAGCHRPGEVAPFPLLTYEDAAKRAPQIAAVTQSRFMPPWKANSHGEFLDENRLSDSEIAMIKQWADESAKEGSKADLPAQPTFTTGWRLGPPDAVVEPVSSYTVAAEGRDEYHTFVLPTSFAEDRFISAVEVRPGNRTVVHHAIVYMDTTGKARKMAAKAGGMDFPKSAGLSLLGDGVLDIWAPGNFPHPLPAGIGMRLPKGADIVLEVHYHRNGKPETDQTRVGLYFCKGPVQQQMHMFPLLSIWMSIPANAANYQTEASIPIPVDETLRNIMPHMHRLGKTMTVILTYPDGKKQTLVDVPHWDFDWQNTYWYRDSVKIPKGSTIKMVASYDNSAGNPLNPNNPPKHVGWGEQTTDEMCIAFLGFTTDNEYLPRAAPATK